ncbi:hypothetical protein CEP54_002987 [Fusarium duplospermum]|uniref:Xylanolytic transcriptional activator regulatory domain-containing protein n=1 Tax=Fusarium duplospermum TaxID=1325734 RepID=A0A428QRW4_9HYPO|nr:hypothetical protein CEP54_002987 [Fusarium duplospermum]
MRSTPNITRSINYPFGGDTQVVTSRDVLLANFPSKQAQMVYLAQYMDTVEAAYCLFDNVSLHDEIKTFWDKPSETSDDWLAQYCTVLSLGCQSHNFVSQVNEKMPGQLLQAAEAFLRRSPFMFRPTPATIRALCLMVIAKQVYAMSCHEADTCWPLTGMTLRLAMGMGLHLDQKDAQRRLWAAVVYFEMRQTLVCGMPCMLRPVDLASSKDYGGIADVVLGDFGQLLLRAVYMATSDDDTVTYDEVVKIDFEIRRHLRDPHGPPLTLCTTSICTNRVPHITRVTIRERPINAFSPAKSLRGRIVDDTESVVCGVLSARVLYGCHVCVLAARQWGLTEG